MIKLYDNILKETGERFTREGHSRRGKVYPPNTWRDFEVVGWVPEWEKVVINYGSGKMGAQTFSSQDYWGPIDVPVLEVVNKKPSVGPHDDALEYLNPWHAGKDD